MFNFGFEYTASFGGNLFHRVLEMKLNLCFRHLIFVLKEDEKMLKELAKSVEKCGELREALSQIDFREFYADQEKGANVRLHFLRKIGMLSELQNSLLNLMKEV